MYVRKHDVFYFLLKENEVTKAISKRNKWVNESQSRNQDGQKERIEEMVKRS
jgi:hypothetical protein